MARSPFDLAPVIGILGFDRYRIHIAGRSQHGGTTPFGLRRDPAGAAAELVAAIPKLVAAVDRAGSATVGMQASRGGAINFTPSEVELSLELRQPTRGALQRTMTAVRARLKAVARSSGCTATMARQDMRPEVKDAVPWRSSPPTSLH